MTEILTRLKTDLEKQRSIRAAADDEIRDLLVAIAAIECNQVKQDSSVSVPRKKTRGALQRGVLDCIRRGFGVVSAIEEELKVMGIETTRSSISNTIQNLQERKQVRKNISTDEWTIRDDDKIFSAPPAQTGEAVN